VHDVLCSVARILQTYLPTSAICAYFKCLQQIVQVANKALSVTLARRCAAGNEPPEIARDCLENGCYHPSFESDVYALGQLMLSASRGKRPQKQIKLRSSAVYQSELQAGFQDPTKVPGQRKHLEYLHELIANPAKQNYAEQVRQYSF